MNHHTHTWHTISRERAEAWAINAGWGPDVLGPGPFKKCSGCRRFQGAPQLEGSRHDKIGLGFDLMSLEEGLIAYETFRSRWPNEPTPNECSRCGEHTTSNDRAEIDIGIVHQSCMLQEEEVA